MITEIQWQMAVNIIEIAKNYALCWAIDETNHKHWDVDCYEDYVVCSPYDLFGESRESCYRIEDKKYKISHLLEKINGSST
jgi:hypothetical protein